MYMFIYIYILHNATRVGRNPMLRAYSLLLTCLHAYMLTCLHAYMLTYLHVYVLACLHACMLEQWHDTCLPPTSTAHMRGIFDFSLPPTSTAQTQAHNAILSPTAVRQLIEAGTQDQQLIAFLF